MTHVRTLLNQGSKVFAVLLVLAFIFSWTTNAQAEHEPANKWRAAASTVDTTGPNQQPIPVLHERLKVSSPRDLVLQLTSECSILTKLQTNNDEQTAETMAQVRMFITIDGTRVPVSTADLKPNTPGVQTDDGRVVFCDREYGRRVTDEEDDDGQDDESDYIRTRTANAFNWFALNTGQAGYDKPYNGNNILDITVYAEFRKDPAATGCNEGTTAPPTLGGTCSDAYIGRRTLTIETTNGVNDETVTPAEPTPAGETPPPPPEPCLTYPVCTPAGANKS